MVCRTITSVLQSADPSQNTKMGGHLTQHIYGLVPPPGKSQAGKTLFEAKGKFLDVWKRYLNSPRITNPVNCSRKQAQQSISLSLLGLDYLGAYACTEADHNGVATKYNSYMADSVFFGFVYDNKSKMWILNTAFPEPST
ncbi:MAG: hypothetical protein AAFQ83_03060 [Bacteroidota bacterium]